jgi:soluble lytic murein transglycosylase-like protein
MTKQASSRKRKPPQTTPAILSRQRALPLAIGIAAVLVGLLVVDALLFDVLPFIGNGPAHAITDSSAPLASFYAPEVLAWRSQIREWARTYDVNPNVIAIVIQIESCGDPVAVSSAGALGLMQVMPFHFENGENMLNPDTNVRRGMFVFYECLTQFADWDLGMALACYNGGPSVTQIDYELWAEETRYYYRWATGLWSDVSEGNDKSQTLSQWLDAGGQRLCRQAAEVAQDN